MINLKKYVQNNRCKDIIIFIALCFLDMLCLEPIAFAKFIKKSQFYIQGLLSVCCILLFLLTIYLSYRFYLHLQRRYQAHIYSFSNLWHAKLDAHDKINIFMTLVYMFVIQIIFGMLNHAFYGSSSSANQHALNTIMSYGIIPLLTIIILSIVLAPITEELLYRACLISFFKSKPKTLFALPCIVSGCAFSLAHSSTNIITFLMFMISGMFLANCYIKSGHLKESIYIHMLWNVFVNGILLICLLK